MIFPLAILGECSGTGDNPETLFLTERVDQVNDGGIVNQEQVNRVSGIGFGSVNGYIISNNFSPQNS
jgi:hypothetical protein